MRIIREILFVLIAAIVLIFLAGAIGERLGAWTDRQPQQIATQAWIAWDVGLLVLGISAIWLWRRYRRRRFARPQNPGKIP
jgi:membrane protein DedA with SNARE-associated domain